VFVKNNNGGSASMIAVGAVFLLMGVTGHGIRSFKFGSIDVLMGAYERAQEQKAQGDDEGALATLDSLIETTPQQLSGKVDAVSTVSGKIHTTTSLGLGYEQAVYNALTEAVWQWGVVLPDVRSSSRRFDWIIRVEQLNIAVEVRAGDKINAQALAWSMEMFMQTADIPINGLFVIVNTSPASDALTSIQSQLDEVIKTVPKLAMAWQPADGSAPLRQGVEALLGS
jgi:hypothetical protein